MTETQFANMTLKIWRFKQRIKELGETAPVGTFMDRRMARSLRAKRARRSYDYTQAKLVAACKELATK